MIDCLVQDVGGIARLVGRGWRQLARRLLLGRRFRLLRYALGDLLDHRFTLLFLPVHAAVAFATAATVAAEKAADTQAVGLASDKGAEVPVLALRAGMAAR